MVSIIVATYRRNTELRKALESLITQSYSNIEIIVVDDNVDAVWNKIVKDIVLEVQNLQATNIVYICNDSNEGSAKTRNIGIGAAKGRYITFLDDDDEYEVMKVEAQVSAMISNNADYSIMDLKLLDEKDKVVETRSRKYLVNYNPEDLMKLHLMHHMTGTDTLMFKTSYISQIGLFPPINLGDEFYLMINAIEAKGKLIYVPKAYVKARIHFNTQGLSSGEVKIQGEKSIFANKRKYFNILSFNERQYIKMRHHAVLAFAYLRAGNMLALSKECILAGLNHPIGCVKLYLDR